MPPTAETSPNCPPGISLLAPMSSALLAAFLSSPRRPWKPLLKSSSAEPHPTHLAQQTQSYLPGPGRSA